MTPGEKRAATSSNRNRLVEFIAENAKYVETEKLNNRECYVIKMENQPDFSYTKM